MVDEHIVSGRSMEVRAVGAAGTTGAASHAAMQTSAPAAAGAGTAPAGAPSLAVLFSSGQFARVAITDRLNCTRPLPDQVERLAGKVDAIYIPIDSTVQSAMPQVVEAANSNQIPVYGSDPVMVQSGALACVSVSNTQLGQRSAEMADEILQGAKVSDVPAEAMTTYQYVVSKAAADQLGIKLPEIENLITIGE